MQKYDIAIIGGGLSGCLAAIALQQSGATVCLIHTPRQADQRTTALNARTIDFLQDLDLWSALRPHAHPIEKIVIAETGKTSFCHFTPPDNIPAMGYIIANDKLFAPLEQALDGVTAIPTQATGFDTQPNHIGVHCANGQTITADLLVAADGRQSRLRDQAGIAHKTHDFAQTAVVCQLQHSKPHHNTAYEYFTPNGPLALLPMPGRHSGLVWSLPPHMADAFLAADMAQQCQFIKTTFGDELGDFSAITALRGYPLKQTLADALHRGRVCLLGEAAHALHPIAGQGFNVTVRDIASLSDLVKCQLSLGLSAYDPDLLQRYTRARRPDIASMRLATKNLNALFLNPLNSMKAVRQLGLHVVERTPKLKSRFVHHAMGYTD